MTVGPSYPLSQAQWAWWLAQKLHPGVPVTVAMYLDLAGPLDLDRARRCAERAACELGAAQLRFRVEDGAPCQYLDPAAQLRFDKADLTSEPDPVAAALDRMECDYSTPLDPAADELTVVLVFAVAPRRHLLYLRSHHIVLDGVGAAAVLRRTADLYRTGLEAAPECGALSVPEILEDERAYRESARARADRDYWRDRLAGLGDSIGLAGRPAAPTVRPHHVTGTLDTATARLLAAAKARHGATFPELAIAAFACFLARMTSSADATLTMPVPARTTAALRRSGGSMSNVVPLRMTGLDASTVGGVVAQVRSTVLGALRHQRFRHEDMRGHEALRAGFGPVVNLLGLVEPLRLGPVTGQARLLALGPVVDLQVNGYQAGPDETSVSLDFQANPARYRHDTVVWQHRMFLDYFARFLAAEPDLPITEVDPAPAAPLARPPAGPVRTLPELLRAGLVADAVAVRAGPRTLTYRALDEASSRWARVLLAGGAGPGEFVAVAIERSLESVLALWAVAQTGACVVPIDPADPQPRIAAVLDSSGARQGITVRSARDRLPRSGIDWLVLDDPASMAAAERHSAAPIDDTERTRPLRPAHPAYLIYTSGTTGIPKGVVVGHRGLGSLTAYLIEHYGIDRNSVLLHSHTSIFDAHLLELLPTFAAGAQVVVAPPSVVVGEQLARLIRDCGCTIVQTAPAVLATLSPARVPAVDVVAIGGEACPAKLVAEWAPHVRLFNGYGPTEVTVMVTETAAMTADGPVTIGVPLPGVLAALLDSRLRRVPDGAKGELYLGGLGVAEYYLGNPAATAARFVADPFGTGGRLYRTGDRVGAGPDGAFEFFGRLDGQVEIHGRRVEPAEIEVALLAEPEIAYATVTVADPGRPEARLVGYVVAAAGARIDTAATLRRLRSELPAALVPSVLVQLDELPVAGNGKVDRAGLIPPVPAPRPYQAPQTDLERLVAARVAAALDRSAVGLDDDFFELGGNSLLGVSVSGELEAATGLPVTVRWLYTSPTVRLLAEAIANYDTADDADDALGALLVLRRSGSRPPLFCVHSAVPLAWCYAGLARYVTDRPIYGLQAPELVAGADAPATVGELVDTYIATMLEVQPQGPYHLLGWSLGGQLAHAIAVRLRARGAVVAVLTMLDSVVIPAAADPPAAPRMRDLLTHLLGDEPEDADAAPDLTAAEAAAELAVAGASFGTGLSAGQLERLHRGYVAGVMLAHSYRPDVYDGDLLYFSATRGITEFFDARMWRPYVTGELIEHPVPATHAQLTNSEVVALIGPLLDRHLERVSGSMALPDGR